jgi:hypothetical protein
VRAGGPGREGIEVAPADRLLAVREPQDQRALEHQQPLLDVLVVIRAQALSRRNLEQPHRLFVPSGGLADSGHTRPVALGILVVVLELGVENVGVCHGAIFAASE